MGAQRGDKVADATGKQAHLEEGIKGYGAYHVACERIAQPVEEAEHQRMDPGMVVGVGNESQHLFKLIDAVGRHDARILVEIIGQPAQHTAEKGAECRMVSAEIDKRADAGGESFMRPVMCIHGILIAGEKLFSHKLFVAGVGKQKEEQIVKEGDKACEDDGEHDHAVESACEKFDIMRIIHRHIEDRKEYGSGERETIGNLYLRHSAVDMPIEEKGEEKNMKVKILPGSMRDAFISAQVVRKLWSRCRSKVRSVFFNMLLSPSGGLKIL